MDESKELITIYKSSNNAMRTNYHISVDRFEKFCASKRNKKDLLEVLEVLKEKIEQTL